MNLHTMYDRRDELNEKLARLLLQGLMDERERYLAVIKNYPADRMEKYGKPMLERQDEKIKVVTQLIEEKFTSTN